MDAATIQRCYTRTICTSMGVWVWITHSQLLSTFLVLVFPSLSYFMAHLLCDAASRTFSAITPATGPTPRYQHSAVISDNNMIVFGGGAETTLLNDLAVFSFGMSVTFDYKNLSFSYHLLCSFRTACTNVDKQLYKHLLFTFVTEWILIKGYLI